MNKRIDPSRLVGINIIGLMVSILALFFILNGFPSTQADSLVSQLSTKIDRATVPSETTEALKNISKVVSTSDRASVSLFVIYIGFTLFVIIVFIINIYY